MPGPDRGGADWLFFYSLVRSYMPHRYSRHQSNLGNRDGARSTPQKGDARQSHNHPHASLTRLIEQDAPLQTNSQLVLMYGPFQTEMLPEAGQGVASWIKDCLRKHGLPSLVRFDYRRRAQIFRRDQFQAWLEPLMERQSY